MVTAALAEQLATANAHMGRVREEYARTKADHELEDGCDDCGRGIDPDNIKGWGYDLGTDDLLCSRCVYGRKQAGGFTPRRTVCGKGHEMTEANTYVFIDAKNIRRDRCRQCQQSRSTEYKTRLKAKKAAARG